MIHRRSPQLPVAFALSLSMLVLAGLTVVLVVSSATMSTTASAAPHSQAVTAPLTSPLVINEVFRSSNPANDYMELYNGGGAPVDLSGYLIHNSSTSPVGTTYLSGLFTNTRVLLPLNYVAISAAQFFTPTRTTLVGSGLQASDYLALATVANDTVPVDLVNWGDPLPSWYYFNFYSNYFFRPTFAQMPAPDGPLSLSRYPNGYDTDTAADWRQLPKSAGYANPSPTPGAGSPTPTTGCEDRYEPDDTAQQAGTIDQNTEQVHTFCTAGGTVKDRDWLQFTAVAGKVYTMLTKDLAGPVDTVITLYDSNLNVLQFNDDYQPGVSLASRIDYTFSRTGTYYLQVRDAKANGGLGFQYTVSLISTGALPPTTTPTPSPTINPLATPTSGPCYDAYEPDGVPETARLLLINTTQHHSICPVADADWARFFARAGKVYSIKTENLGVGVDTFMYLFDSNATTVMFENDDGGDGLASRIDFYPQRDDWYFVQVKNAGDIGGSEQTYDLSLAVVPGVPQPPGTATAVIAPVVTVTPAGPTKVVAPTKPPVPTPTQASSPPTPTAKPTAAAVEPAGTVVARAGPTIIPGSSTEVIINPTAVLPGVPKTGTLDGVNIASRPAQLQAPSQLAPLKFSVFYDANGNKALDTGEGVRGLQVYFTDGRSAIDRAANLVTGNDGIGTLSLPVANQMIFIPYLGINMPLAGFPGRVLHSLWLPARKLPDMVP